MFKEVLGKFGRCWRYCLQPANLIYIIIFGLLMGAVLADFFEKINAVEELLKSFGLTDMGVVERANLTKEQRDTLNAAASQVSSPHFLMLKVAFIALLLRVKLYDGLMRIYKGYEDEPVPFAPTSEVSFFIPFKYSAGLFVLSLFFLPVLFSWGQESFELVRDIVFAVFGVAILMGFVGSEGDWSVFFKPGEWLKTIENIGYGKYALIAALPPLLFLPISYLVVMPLHKSNLIAFSYGAGIVDAFNMAISTVFVGFFMASDDDPAAKFDPEMEKILAEGPSSYLIGDLQAQRDFASEMKTVDYLMNAGDSASAESIINQYTSEERDVATYFPAFRRLYDYHRSSSGSRHDYAYRRLLTAAIAGFQPAYELIRPQLARIADIYPERIDNDAIFPLAQLALRCGDNDLVLALTKNFNGRAPGHEKIAENYHLAAKAFGQRGQPAQGAALLERLIAAYPEHPKMKAFQHSLKQLQSQAAQP